ncbi:hypothetical protein, partial [uncultured Dubosiella sp.]|uniref:hypothetical protein n=1 Tax=uncultured Dubosiella sp. TaxID=1937011 RepID=UPI00261C49D1
MSDLARFLNIKKTVFDPQKTPFFASFFDLFLTRFSSNFVFIKLKAFFEVASFTKPSKAHGFNRGTNKYQ